jgi:hypothetical protein
MTTTWNPSDKSTNTILTDSNHHAQNGTTGSNSGARGTTSHDTGKWYLEYSDNVLSGFHSRRGFATAAQDLTDYSNAHMFGVTEGGGGDGSGGGISAVAGAVVQIAIDIDAGKYWYRKAGDTLWQGGGGSGVALGTSGADYTGSVAAGTALFPAFVSFSNSGQLGATTLNCGDRPFASPVPAGWQAWDDDPTNTHAWNPSDISSNTVLADSNHSATNTTTGGNSGARATTSHNTGKWYLEFSNNVASGFHSRRGFATAAQDLTDYSTAHMFGVTEGGGGDSAGSSISAVEGVTVQIAIDIDAGKYWFKKVGDSGWVGSAGSPVSVGTSGCDYTSIIAAATAIYPAFVTFANSGHLGATTINLGDRTFEETPPAGYAAWDPGATNGTAGGATKTVTVSLIAGHATVPGNAVGLSKTVTVSLIPGTAHQTINATANGHTFTVSTSLPHTGTASGAAIDGTPIYEITFNGDALTRYQEADYDSIYSRGRRIQSGLFTAGSSPGWSNIFSPAIDILDGDYGTGFTPDNGTGNIGQYMWFATDRPITIQGFTMAGKDERDPGGQGSWSFHGGFGIGQVEPGSYTSSFDSFEPAQVNQLPGTTSTHIVSQEYLTQEALKVAYSYWEFKWVGGTRPEGQFCEELLFLIAHSNLDGGDRRSTNSRPDKRVLFSMSSDWSFNTGGSYFDPANALFDGFYAYPGSFEVPARIASIGTPANALVAVTTVGAWLQFVFPRPVYFQRLMIHLVSNSDHEVYSGANPTLYGKWHWEYSKNSGSTWTACAESWSFNDGGGDMIAPRSVHDDFVFDFTDAGIGENGVTHWRMVLDQGPAFGNRQLKQFVFELFDATGQEPTFEVHFSDDVDGTSIPFTPGAPGSPYVVAFTDAFDDGFNTATFTNIPNPVLTVAFTDDGQFDTWSDLYPSLVVQTIINATGR